MHLWFIFYMQIKWLGQVVWDLLHHVMPILPLLFIEWWNTDCSILFIGAYTHSPLHVLLFLLYIHLFSSSHTTSLSLHILFIHKYYLSSNTFKVVQLFTCYQYILGICVWALKGVWSMCTPFIKEGRKKKENIPCSKLCKMLLVLYAKTKAIIFMRST